jgi:glycogen operon protein
MIALRAAHPVLGKEEFYKEGDLHWFNPEGNRPDWDDPNAKKIACFIVEMELEGLYLMFNADTVAADFILPPLPHEYGWRRSVDTYLPLPNDLAAVGKEAWLKNPNRYPVEARSSVILLGRKR